MLFVLMRLAGYAGVLAWMLATHPPRPWWHWLAGAAVAAWGVWDRWKRPGDPASVMRRGVWAEFGAVVVWSLLTREPGLLFLLISPLARAAVHLPGLEAAAMGLAGALAAFGAARVTPVTPMWLPATQAGALALLGAYAYTLGQLVRERDRARQLALLAAFEREQRSRDQERVRIAGALHDLMGQYWTGVIRALDVVLMTEGETSRTFVTRARDAAMDGLAEMRAAVRDWNEGRQTPEQWLACLDQACRRFRDQMGVQVAAHLEPPDWPAFPDPLLAAEAVARTGIEALTNAVRHGGATSVRIELRTAGSALRLTVADDGTGLPPDATPGTGTRSLTKLVARAGGRWSLTAPGHPAGRGATVTLEIPARAEEATGT